LIAVLALVFVTTACNTGGEATPAPTAAAGDSTTAPVRASSDVVADASVVPVRNADLSLPNGGIVDEILVNEGDTVEAGQVLLRLESARQQAAVAQAQAGLARAQAQLAALQAGSRPEEIAAAQAAVDAAQAQVDRLSAGAKAEDIAAAQAGVDAARASLEKVREGASDQQIIAAQTDLANAEAALRLAQSAYDKVAGDPDIGQLPQSLQLEQATNSANAARARLADLQKGASAADIAAAQAQVRQAQAQLDSLRAPARASDLSAAQAELRRAQAQLDLARAGARPENISGAEADVASARAALQQAEAALAEAELVAPFTGTIAEMLPAVGEQVGPGVPVVKLADLSSWQIETDDLTELNVVRIGVGSPATIEFDALPDVELSGKVVQIKPIGVNKQGDITYTVVVLPDQNDPRLKWNMTAVVTVQASD
jgi:multidrug efflux pump subunit AcrA (membrane-fusion protein)